jgi:hypothetical protein
VHVRAKVLPNAERDGAATEHRKERERDGHRVWTEQPDGVDATEELPEDAHGRKQRTGRLGRLREAPIARQRLEVELCRHGVTPLPPLGIEAPYERDALEMGCEPREEARKRQLCPELSVVATVRVVGVDGKSHARPAAP